jgi:hypothetical protein
MHPEISAKHVIKTLVQLSFFDQNGNGTGNTVRFEQPSYIHVFNVSL